MGKEYELNNTPYYPNLFGIRSKENIPNAFNDLIGAIYYNGTTWDMLLVEGTTDAGLYWQQNPMNINGTAVIIPGQYKNCYKVGLHTGYKAYQQVGVMNYIRDNNKDKVLDLLYKVVGFKKYREIAATNLHHASNTSTSSVVDKWSAGCQVVAGIVNFGKLLGLGERWVTLNPTKNLFNYTLFEEQDIK